MLGLVALRGLALWGLLGLGFFGGAFELKGEQALQNLVVAQVYEPACVTFYSLKQRRTWPLL